MSTPVRLFVLDALHLGVAEDEEPDRACMIESEPLRGNDRG